VYIEKVFHLEHFHLRNQIVVRSCDVRWNQIESSILRMHEKLVDLGFIRYDDEIHIIEPMEKQKYV
jgi:hypothetical protein